MIEKKVLYLGSADKDLKKLPQDVKDVFAYGIYLASVGDKHPDAKPLKGFKGASVLEIVEDFRGDTYRAVYTVKFKDAVYVLHVFQKKSKKGIATPKGDIDLVKSRLKWAHENYKELSKKRGKKR